MLKGIQIKVIGKKQIGVDELNCPIYEETTEFIDDVLVAPATDAEIAETVNLYGRKALYTLAIPKGNQTDFIDKKIEFFSGSFITIGCPLEGIEENIPLRWNKKVRVEQYGGH